MRTLYLLRHAKAAPGSDTVRDPDRPLSDQGRRQARRVGEYLKNQNIVHDLALSSTALRARETTEVVLTEAECAADVRYDQRIYEATRQQLLEVISEIDDGNSRVLLVGHNPGLEELIHHLTDHFVHLATATLAKIDLPVSEWTKATGHSGQLDSLVKPDEVFG